MSLEGLDPMDFQNSTTASPSMPFSGVSDQGGYTCTYHGCSRRFETPVDLQKHKRAGHRSQAPSVATASSSPEGHAWPHRCDRINPYTSRPCNSIFSRPYDLTRHEDTIHNVRTKVRCTLCVEEKIFSRLDALKRHLRVVHPNDDPRAVIEAAQKERDGNATPVVSNNPKAVASDNVPAPELPAQLTSMERDSPSSAWSPTEIFDQWNGAFSRADTSMDSSVSASTAGPITGLEESRRKRLKVMKHCEGCRRRKIKCDLALVDSGSCTPCTRMKIQCEPRVSLGWTADEDRAIKELRMRGTAWDEVAAQLPGRSSLQCRLRYTRLSEQQPSSRQGSVEAYYQATTASFSYSSSYVRRQSGNHSPMSMSPAGMSPSRGSPVSMASDGATTPPPIRFFAETPPPPDALPSASQYSLLTLTKPYKYTPLERDEFRLLLLQRGDINDPITMHILKISLEDLLARKYPFYALSYAWGTDPILGAMIRARDADIDAAGNLLADLSVFPEHFEHRIRPNLYAALRQLRSCTDDLWLWIDSICINQSSDKEKSQQLPHLLQIYNNAAGVCIWLGEPEPQFRSDDAPQDPLDFIHFIVNLKFLDRWMYDPDPDEAVLASFVVFAQLLRQPWFNRRWVIQEVSTCRHASVHYGDKKINWIDFVDAVQLFVAHIDQIRVVYSRSKLHSRNPDAFTHIESSGAIALVEVANTLLQKNVEGDIIGRLLDIDTLVSTFIHFEATDPRDVVYALLPLAKDANESGPGHNPHALTLEADYALCAHRVYMQFVQYVATRNDSLDIICKHWAPKIKQGSCGRPNHYSEDCALDDTPSWIGLVTQSSFGPPSKMTGRLNGDSLVQANSHPVYHASKDSVPSFRFEASASRPTDNLLARPSSSFDTLVASGLILGHVTQVSSRVVDGIISSEALLMSGWENTSDVNDIPECLWRTLVADRTSNGKKAPGWYRRACMHVLTKRDFNGDLNTSKIIASYSLPKVVTDEYLRRVQAVVWNRKFFICASENDDRPMFGLGPRAMDIGDAICILYGCSVPVVLRKRSQSNTAMESSYKLVGEAFVYEHMDGQAIVAKDIDVLESETMELRIH